MARAGMEGLSRFRNTPQREEASGGTVGAISIGSLRPASRPLLQKEIRTLLASGPTTSTSCPAASDFGTVMGGGGAGTAGAPAGAVTWARVAAAAGTGSRTAMPRWARYSPQT